MDKSDTLRKSALFSDLNKEQLRVVEELGKTEVFELGEIICQHGELSKNVYLIKDGWVQIYIGVKPLPKCHLQTASTYDVVGWTAMLEPYVCTATVKAIEKTTALAFDGARLQYLCRERPDIGYEIFLGVARVITERLHHTYTKLVGYTEWISEMQESSVLD